MEKKSVNIVVRNSQLERNRSNFPSYVSGFPFCQRCIFIFCSFVVLCLSSSKIFLRFSSWDDLILAFFVSLFLRTFIFLFFYAPLHKFHEFLLSIFFLARKEIGKKKCYSWNFSLWMISFHRLYIKAFAFSCHLGRLFLHYSCFFFNRGTWKLINLRKRKTCFLKPKTLSILDT